MQSKPRPMRPQTSPHPLSPSPSPQRGGRTLESLSLRPDDLHPKKGGVAPLIDCNSRRHCPSAGSRGPRGARARRRRASPDRGGPAVGSSPAPAQEPEACRPVMASEWPLAGKGCPVELQTAVTMENLPSPPRQLPACLHARPRNSSPRPAACRAKLSLSHATQRALQTWPRGGTAGARLAKATSCSSSVGKGRGREGEVQELENLGAPGWRERNRPERVGAAPATQHRGG